MSVTICGLNSPASQSVSCSKAGALIAVARRAARESQFAKHVIVGQRR